MVCSMFLKTGQSDDKRKCDRPERLPAAVRDDHEREENKRSNLKKSFYCPSRSLENYALGLLKEMRKKLP